MLRVFIPMCIVSLIFCQAACAGMNPDVKVAIHVMLPEARTCTENFPVITGCEDVETSVPGMNHECDVFPVFFDLVEYSRLDYAIVFWTMAMSVTFNSCSEHATVEALDYDTRWNVSQTWDECQPGPVAVPGWFSVGFGEGQVCVEPHPSTDSRNVGDCREPMGIDHPPCGFCAGIGHTSGCYPCAPCEPSSSDDATWGGVKALFR